MNTTRLGGMIGIVVGLIMVYAAFNSGDRVIVGALPTGQPIFDHVTNKPMLGIGSVLTAASILAFAMSFMGSSSTAVVSPSPEQTATGEARNPSDSGMDSDSEPGSDSPGGDAGPAPLDDTRE